MVKSRVQYNLWKWVCVQNKEQQSKYSALGNTKMKSIGEQKFLGLRGHTVDREVMNVSDVGVQPLEDKIRNTKGNADLQSIVSAAADEYKRMRIKIYS